MLLDKFPSTINTTTDNSLNGWTDKDGTQWTDRRLKSPFSYLRDCNKEVLSALIKIRRSLYFAIIIIFNLSRTLSLLVQSISVARIHIVS